MTGYLQRLAAGAATSDRPIHPVLPPIFSTADGGSDHPGLEEFSVSRAADVPAQSIARPAEPRRQATVTETVEPVAAATVAPQPSPQSSATPLVHTHVIAAALDSRDVASPQHADQLPRADRSRREDQPRRDDRGRPQQDGERPDGGEAETIRVDGPPRPDRAASRVNADEDGPFAASAGPVEPVVRREAGRPERTFVSLLASTARTHDETPAAAVHRRSPPTSSGTGPARRAQDAPRMASEPHEVQIHIGRIEVTAVPPAPPRAPAAAPRRNAMSLDDYLKRRNGRAP